MPNRLVFNIEITAEVKAETKKAFLLSDDGENETWVPKSQLTYAAEPETGDIIVFEMPEWLAVEKGLV